MRTMQMRHTCLWTSGTHEKGQKRGGSDEKVQKLWIFLGVQEQKAEQRSNASRPAEEKKTESEKETNPQFIFTTTHISKDMCDFCLYSLKK